MHNDLLQQKKWIIDEVVIEWKDTARDYTTLYTTDYLQFQATRVSDSASTKLRGRCGVDNGRMAGLTSGSRVAARLDFECGVLPGVPPQCGKVPIDNE